MSNGSREVEFIDLLHGIHAYLDLYSPLRILFGNIVNDVIWSYEYRESCAQDLWTLDSVVEEIFGIFRNFLARWCFRKFFGIFFEIF